MALSAACLSACQKSPTSAMEAQTVTNASTVQPIAASSAAPTLKPNVSQQFTDNTLVQQRLKKALPEIAYTTDNLPAFAQQVNQVTWSSISGIDESAMVASTVIASSVSATSASGFHSTIDYSALRKSVDNDRTSAAKPDTPRSKPILINPSELVVFKTQALLNWHGHSVGPVTGVMNKNTIKAMQIFQQKHHLPMTTTMNDATWAALTNDETLNKQPIFINYRLTPTDLMVTKTPKDMQYKTAIEAVAEKFHMSQKLLSRLNPNTPLKPANVITVYNPYQPNMTEVTKVISDKKNNILYAYAANGELVASYPTTVGSNYTPSPSGTLKVKNRVLNPTYNPDFSSKDKWLPPGPNNPVGRVWIGLSKRSFGIHGSPDPERISAQKSHGCVRLTNWDALSLYGTIADDADVVFQ